MCVGYIYEIYDLRTGLSVYVGSTTKHPMLRWAQHVKLAFCGPYIMKVNTHMRDEGPENFHWRVREETFYKTKLDLRKREQVWMDQLSPTCNDRRATASRGDRTEYFSRWSKRMVTCECGAEVSRGYLPKHRKSAKHAQRLKGLKDVLVVKSSK